MSQLGLGFAATAGRLAGVDEVGRGPLAGPVVAAVVILPPQGIDGIADSKCLAPDRRVELAECIRTQAVAWALGRAEVEEIDRINILQATFLAMRRAVAALAQPPDYALIDGHLCPQLPCPTEPVVGGDGLIPAIGAASIIAKVARDAEMVALDAEYPDYGFARHKGYGTPAHLEALQRFGPSPIHRRSFQPVKGMLGGEPLPPALPQP